MLRPRNGYDFQFSDFEIKVILQDLTLFKDSGADGFVFGALTITGDIDISACASVVLAANPLPVTFHRAFDVATMDPIKMAQQIFDLGFKRLLTSGRCSKAIAGVSLIKDLVEIMKDRLIIIPGSGINIENLKDILVTTLAHEFHGSEKVLKQINVNSKCVGFDSNDNTALVCVTQSDVVQKLLNIFKNHTEQK